MKTSLTKLIPACAALCLSAGLYASNAAEGVQVNGAYARAVPPGQSNSAAFLRLTNNTPIDHALVAAHSDVSDVTELHTHLMEEGMMKMRRVEKVDLPAGETVTLQPGGLHIMLIGLKRQLSPGERLSIDLVFEDGSRASLTAPIKSVQETMQQHQDAGH